RLRIISLAVLISVVGPWCAGPAWAGFMLVPSGLHPGDPLRVVFLSSATQDAASSNIADYDQFITSLAVAAGLHTYFRSPGASPPTSPPRPPGRRPPPPRPWHRSPGPRRTPPPRPFTASTGDWWRPPRALCGLPGPPASPLP